MDSILGVLLTSGLNVWLLATFKWSILDKSTVSCKINSFLIRTILDFSVLIILVMTGEKLKAVLHPFEAHSNKLNKKKSSIILISVLLVCVLLNSHFLFTHSLVPLNIPNDFLHYKNLTIFENFTENNSNSFFLDSHCSYTKFDGFYEYVWPYIQASVYSFVPLIVLIILNILIFRSIIKAEIGRLTMIEAQNSSEIKNNAINFNERLKERKTLYNFLLASEINNSEIKPRLNARVRFYSTAEGVNVQNVELLMKTTCRPDLNVTSSKQIGDDQLSTSKNISTIEFIKRKSITVRASLALYNNYKNVKSTKKRLTLTMFLVNFSFCLMSMPIVILEIYYYNRKKKFINYVSTSISKYEDFETNYKDFDSLKAIAELLQNLNHSMNFFLYCISGKTFRNEAFVCFLTFKAHFIQFKTFLIRKFQIKC